MSRSAVLFDLDGTLADTAPDLGAALNHLLEEEGQAALPLAQLRPYVSGGARSLLQHGFGIAPGDPAQPALAERFLAHYARALCVATELFPGVPALLDQLDARGIKWGIVTNKAERFTLPLVERLGLRSRAACVISGDTAARPKPHPDPLLLACAQMQVDAGRACYVGDDQRDIVAGRAAGMLTIVAAYGYLGGEEHYTAWQADAVIAEPNDLLGLIA